MSQQIVLQRSTSNVPVTLNFGSPAISSAFGKLQFWIGNSSNNAVLINDNTIVITSIQSTAVAKPTTTGYYIFTVTPSDGLPSGVSLNDIAVYVGGSWYKVYTYNLDAPASISVGLSNPQTYIKNGSGSWSTVGNVAINNKIYYQSGVGNDTNVGYDINKPFATIAAASIAAGNTGNQIVVTPQTSSESPTITALNQTFSTLGMERGGLANFTNTWTFSATGSSSNRIAGITMATLNHTGTAGLYLQNMRVNTAFSNSSSGYVQAENTDFQGSSLTGTMSITGSGNKVFQGNNNIGFLIINNASAVVNLSNNIISSPITLTTGTLGVNNTPVYSATNGGNAITAAAGNLFLDNASTLNPNGTAGKINIASGVNYSFSNFKYDAAGSTINGGANNLGRVSYFDALSAVNLTASQLVSTDANKKLVSITALPNSTTATTQSANDNSTKIATTAYADNASSNASVIGKVLTGFAAAGTRAAIIATDTILQGFGKCQKYFNDLLTSFNGANQLVQLDGTSKLPAIDGSQLTNLPAKAWGTITGTLSDQTDLQTALNGKQATLTNNVVGNGNLTQMSAYRIKGNATNATANVVDLSADQVLDTINNGTSTTNSLATNRGGTGTRTAFTQGSVVFAGASGVYNQDNTNFFWDDTNNRLGLGTNAPVRELHVRSSNTNPRILIESTANNSVPELNFVGKTSGGGGTFSSFYMNSTGAPTVFHGGADRAQFYSNNNESFILIKSTTNSAAAQLVCSRNGNDTYVGPSSTNSFDIFTFENIPIHLGLNNILKLRLGTAASNYLRLDGYTSAGTLQVDGSGNVSSTSDERLKDIQGSFVKGLTEILNINPILYKWKEIEGRSADTVNEYAGFSAQNVQQYIPEAVIGTQEDIDENGDTIQGLGLSDRTLIAALVNAIKELKTINDALEARVVALENA